MHAKSMNAHRRNIRSAECAEILNHHLDQLWDCCVVRDRILAFGLNRSTHINESEARESSVATKIQENRRMASDRKDTRIPSSFSALYGLALVLGQILHALKGGSSNAPTAMIGIKLCSVNLDEWFETAKTSLPNACPKHGTAEVNQIVILIYY